MSQAIKVALQKHTNDTFDVIYRNNISRVITDMEQQAKLDNNANFIPTAPKMLWDLIAGVMVGVEKQLIEDTYKDPADRLRAEAFLDEMADEFGLTVASGDDSVSSGVEDLSNILCGNTDYDEIKAILAKIEGIHMSGSVVANENSQQIRGLVTITYRKMDGLLGKVRLSGQLPMDVGIALRQPYLEAKQLNLVMEVPFLEPIAPGELKTVRPPKKTASAPVKPKEVISYAKLSPEDKEEIAGMVTRNLIQAMTGSFFLSKPASHPTGHRKSNHKHRAAAN